MGTVLTTGMQPLQMLDAETESAGPDVFVPACARVKTAGERMAREAERLAAVRLEELRIERRRRRLWVQEATVDALCAGFLFGVLAGAVGMRLLQLWLR